MSNAVDPISSTGANYQQLIDRFIMSRRDGLSPRTIKSYRDTLKLAITVIGVNITGQDIQQFLYHKQCSNGGKHGYYRVLRAFYNWLYSPRSGYGLNVQDNPILIVDPPKVEKKILPSLTLEQVEQVIAAATCVRDRAIISLFVDSGLRLSELANIKVHDIDWEHRLIKVKCKGNKEGLAPFGKRTGNLLVEWLSEYKTSGGLWDVNAWGIIDMLDELKKKTGLPCNAHTFRRTFASILAKRGIDSLHIMRLGRWRHKAIMTAKSSIQLANIRIIQTSPYNGCFQIILTDYFRYSTKDFESMFVGSDKVGLILMPESFFITVTGAG